MKSRILVAVDLGASHHVLVRKLYLRNIRKVKTKRTAGAPRGVISQTVVIGAVIASTQRELDTGGLGASRGRQPAHHDRQRAQRGKPKSNSCVTHSALL